MLYKGSCHCGNMKFEVEGELTQLVFCNCSICARKGALLWSVPRDKLRLLGSGAGVGNYMFNTQTIAHRFCQTCGMHPYAEDAGDAARTLGLRQCALPGGHRSDRTAGDRIRRPRDVMSAAAGLVRRPWYKAICGGGAMRKLILRQNMSADGFVGGPNGEIDWIFKSFDDSAMSWTLETLWQVGVHIMGSRTFRDMAAHWPRSTEPIAAPMNEIPKVVFTRKGLDQAATTQALADATRLRPQGSVAPTPSVLESWTNPGVAQGESGRGDRAIEAAGRQAHPGPWRRQLRAQPGAGTAAR